MFPQVTNWGTFFRWERDRDRKPSPFVELSFRQHLSEYEAAPVALRNTFEQGDGPGGVLNWPSNNPFNPLGDATFGFDLNEDFRWRLVELDNRIFDNRSDYTRSLIGLKGKAADHRWEAAVLYARSDARFTTRNIATDPDMQAALNGTLPGLEGLFANPFGPSDAGIFDALRTSNTNKSSFATASLDAFVSGELLEITSGSIRYATGFEVRHEALSDRRSPLSEAGQLLGGAEGASFRATREVYAAFFEAALPLPFSVEIRGALRSEYYSDFGSTTKPKISASWQPFGGFMLRGSYGQAFLAPNLPFLFTPQLTTFSSSPLPDPKRNNELAQIQIRTGGNPDLQPEETEVWSTGILWRQHESGQGLSVELSWFQFTQEDLLSSFDAGFLIANEDLFPDRVIRSAPPVGSPPGTVGPIAYIDNIYRNTNTGRYRGYDFDFAYTISNDFIGFLRWNVTFTYIDQLSFSARRFPGEPDVAETDFAGAYGNPKWRGNFGASWSKGLWNTALFVNYIGKYGQQFVDGYVKHDYRLNLTIGRREVFGWDVSLQIRNLLNAEPPFDFSRAEGYNINVNSGESRFVTLSLKRHF